MNMGQCSPQLDNTYMVNKDGPIVSRFPDAPQHQYLPAWTRVRVRGHQWHFQQR